MKPEVSLPCSQNLPVVPIQVNVIHIPKSISQIGILILSSNQSPGPPKDLLPSGFPIKIPYAFTISSHPSFNHPNNIC